MDTGPIKHYNQVQSLCIKNFITLYEDKQTTHHKYFVNNAKKSKYFIYPYSIFDANLQMSFRIPPFQGFKEILVFSSYVKQVNK